MKGLNRTLRPGNKCSTLFRLMKVKENIVKFMNMWFYRLCVLCDLEVGLELPLLFGGSLHYTYFSNCYIEVLAWKAWQVVIDVNDPIMNTC